MIITKSVSVELTPELVAEAFCEMNASEQAAMFEHIYTLSQRWAGTFAYQMQTVVEMGGASGNARTIMVQIGEAAHE
jgi:hypothetical protein